ncbi:hypothetical protein AB6A23_01185 [Paenibacillus tarimensis]
MIVLIPENPDVYIQVKTYYGKEPGMIYYQVKSKPSDFDKRVKEYFEKAVALGGR